MEPVYVIALVAALIAVYFLFFRKKQGPELGAPPLEKKLADKRDAASTRPEAKAKEKAGAPSNRLPGDLDKPASARTVEEAAPGEVPIDEVPPSAPARRSLLPVHNVAGLRRGLAKSRSDEGFFGKLKALISSKREVSPE